MTEKTCGPMCLRQGPRTGLSREQPTDLNHGVERGAKLALELLFDLYHVDLTATDDHSYQSAVLGARTLPTAQ